MFMFYSGLNTKIPICCLTDKVITSTFSNCTFLKSISLNFKKKSI